MRDDELAQLRPDYIVVGGGSAGCVVAGRLSENSDTRVLLLEAGGSSDSFMVRMPAGVSSLVENPRWDWAYQTAADPSLNGRSFSWSAGKCLGGSSSINGQVYMRGIPDDFDEWARLLGNTPDWSYRDMRGFFDACETYLGDDHEGRGKKGPQYVSPLADPHPVAHAFMAAGESMGYPRTDLNGDSPEGFDLTQSTQFKGSRFSAYDAFIRPNRSRKNLFVVTRAPVDRVLFESGKATGVEVARRNKTVKVVASKAVVLSAGAVASPALLLRSGVGERRQLETAGVPVVHELNGVGKNLQEHPGVGISKFVSGRSLNVEQSPHRIVLGLLRYLFQRRGPLSSPVVQAMAYVRTAPELARPDVQLHFLPFAYVLKKQSKSALTAEMPKRAAVMFNSTVCKPQGRGEVRIAPSDRGPQTVIDHQLLGHEGDVNTLVRSCKFICQLYEHQDVRAFVLEDCNPAPVPASDDEWVEYVRNNANVAYHSAGTCKMGRQEDPTAVVDSRLRVIGLRGLRVVDASIMPTLTSANTNAPVMAIAEKGASLLASGN